ncbi:AraC family transcriptional regulator [Anaerococcus sp.]|uniref:AraC family transcriptional regulator n=1 Tax=Anaerococcus sp. TaxID=1872515 RepID=UPI0028FE0A66|nr:AraC family transcriptional regulator [Anaerococcus sp.]MDU1828963.1 AraC family transcriptional regulator [Anaerococcus sp.]
MDKTNFRDLDQEDDLLDVEIKVLDAQKHNFNRNYSSRIQFHPFTYFYYIIKGNGKLSIENETVDVKDNDLVVINSNIGHTLYVDNNSDSCEIIGFGVESLSVSSINPNNLNKDNSNYFHINLDRKKYNTDLFNEIVNEFNSEKLFSKAMANAKASIFIINALRYNEEKVTVSHDKKVNRQIDYIKNYIDNNYAEDIKLEQLSTMAYMNKFHLISEFKQSYRVTPIEYLILKRIEISKNLLISTNHSMEEISSIVGFNSQSYFNQVFKKKVDQTPPQFRKKHRL